MSLSQLNVQAFLSLCAYVLELECPNESYILKGAFKSVKKDFNQNKWVLIESESL